MTIKKLQFYLQVILLLPALSAAQSTSKITIVAAANLKVVLDSIASVYKKQYPHTNPQIIYGASGKLFEQISQGAPFDLFCSADMEYPLALQQKKLCLSPIKMYAIGKLAIYSKKIDPNKKRVYSLMEPTIRKIAIANPLTAPYGQKAVESMKYYKVYEPLKDELVFGENSTQAAQFVSSGAADIGIIPLSLILSPKMQKEGGAYYILPQKSHRPLQQGCVLLKQSKGNRAARLFYDFMASQKAIAILHYYGYDTPKK